MNRRSIFILALATLISVSGYLAASAFVSRVGFPLDDSWIHLTYARNLALRGEWSFTPGIPSAGSTAPLWPVLLSIGFLLGLAPYAWTYFLGGMILFALSVVAESFARRALTTYQQRVPYIGLFFIFEWHLAWAAGSGMETLLHTLIVTLVLLLLTTESPHSLTLGLLTGLSVWTRPDGITLLGPVAFTILLSAKPLPVRIRSLVVYLIGVAVLVAPYLYFNWSLSDRPFPNPFYAKQAEYAAWQATPLLTRIGQTLLELIRGPALILLPGAVAWIVGFIRKREWGMIAGALWFFGFIAMYIMRLPPYHHGRYLMPVLPTLFLWGMLGITQHIHLLTASRNFKLLAATCAAAMIFLWGLGAYFYSEDVACIEGVMVDVAQWTDTNIPPDTVVAVHDIGAMGYFDRHKIIDLAGLVSPEVVPFMRDEDRLAAYFDEHGVEYFVAFPFLYPKLASQSRVVYRSQSPYAEAVGGDIYIYQWRTR